MSVEARAWVKKDRTVRNAYDRLVLLMLADDADAETGYAFSTGDQLAAVTCLGKETVLVAVARLEDQGVLLVRRPEGSGRGHFNQYVLVLGRDPASLEHCWHHTGARTVTPRRAAGVPRKRRATVPRKKATAPSRKRVTAPEQPAPVPDSATLAEHQKGSAPPTDSNASAACGEPAKRSAPPTVYDDEKRSVEVQITVGPADWPQTPSPKGVDASRDAFRGGPVENRRRIPGRRPPPDPLIEDLRRLVTQRAADVPWDLDAGQQAMVVAQLALCGLEALVAESVACVRARGAPRTARAWITPWELLRPPEIDLREHADLPAPCGFCDGHRGGHRFVVDDLDRPIRPCPTCHPSALVQARF